MRFPFSVTQLERAVWENLMPKKPDVAALTRLPSLKATIEGCDTYYPDSCFENNCD
jgi:hypothetical protein